MCFKRLSPLFKRCMLLKYYFCVCRTLSSHSVPKWRAVSQYKDRFSRYGIPMLKIRRSRLAWRHLYIETARRLYHCWYICGSYKWGVMPIIATHFLCNTCKPSNDSPMTHDLYWPVIDQGSAVALIMQCYMFVITLFRIKTKISGLHIIFPLSGNSTSDQYICLIKDQLQQDW